MFPFLRTWWRQLRARRQLSKALRRRRRLRTVIGILFGLLWSSSLMFLLTQTGWLSFITFESLPWFGGILIGIACSLMVMGLRPAIRSLRIRIVGGAFGATIVVAVLLGLPVAPAAVAQAPPALCEVSISGPGISGQSIVNRSTRSDPVVVDLSQVSRFEVAWVLPEDGERRRWWIDAEVAGYSRSIFDYEVDPDDEDDDGVYLLEGLADGVTPGIYPVRGGFDDVCPADTGFVRIVAPLHRTWTVWAALIGLGGGLGGLGFVAWGVQSALWSYTSPDRVTVEILDPNTGKVMAEPLIRGASYVARVSIELPDRPVDYQGIPGSIELAVGAYSITSAAWSQSAIDPRSSVNQADLPFEVPADPAIPMQLHTELSVAGNLLQSIRIEESILEAGGRQIADGAGQVVYRAAGLSAEQLLTLTRIDAVVLFRGHRDGERLQVVGLKGSGVGREISKPHEVSVSDTGKAADQARLVLGAALRSWEWATSPSDREAAMRRVARAGIELRASILGELAAPTAADGTVQIAVDTAATGALTLPLGMIYDGPDPTDDVPACGEPSGNPNDHVGHGELLCPFNFWGIKYVAAWPNGWAPRIDRNEQPGIGLAVQRLRRIAAGTSRALPTVLDNRHPTRIVRLLRPDLIGPGDRLHALFQRYGPDRLTVTEVEPNDLTTAPIADLAEAEIINVVAHGASRGDASADDTDVFVLDFGALQVDGAAMRRLVGAGGLPAGPLALVNACWSGVIDRPGQAMIDALNDLGTRAIVVTETEVEAARTARTAEHLMAQVFAGEAVDRALLIARRSDLADPDGPQLSALAHTYYGPPGLRLANPLTEANG
ncbi:MAG: hypothetical protein AAF547_04485 [Actinomycetota bacterium]